MTEFQIEKNVPVPTEKPVYGTHLRKYPWHLMTPGDSFVVPNLAAARSAHTSFVSYRRSKHTRIRPSWYIRFMRQEDGTYRLWLIDKNQ